MNNNFVKIIFLLFLGIMCIYPQVSLAGEDSISCTDDFRKETDKAIKKEVERSMNILSQHASNLNRAADQYISDCKTPAEDLRPIDAEIVGIANDLGIDYGNDDIWRSTGYNWAAEEPPAEKLYECRRKLQNVIFYLNRFSLSNRDAVAAINRARIYKNRYVCVCAANGDSDAIKVCISNADEALANDPDACKPFTTYQEEFSNKCLLCPIFRVILSTVSQVASVAWEATAEPLTKIVEVVFLILLAVEVLKAVAAVAGSKITSLAKGVLVLSAKVAFTVLLLSNSVYIYKYFLSPVLEGGLEMGVAIANASGSPGAHCTETTEERISSSTFSEKLYNSVLSTVKCFGEAAAVMPAIGRGLTCNAWKDSNFGVPNISMWLSGVIMYVLGIMIWLAISFYMIDCTVQIGMLGGLVPLLIACWPFKLTETYTFKGCKMLMNSFFTYAMVGIVLLIGMAITSFAVGGGDIEKLQMAMNNNDLETLRELCDLGAIQLLILAASAVFAMKLVGQTGDLADQFSKGSGSDIGKELGGTAASAVTGMAKSAGKTGLKALGGIGKYASDEVGLTAAVNKGLDKVTGTWQKGWAALGRGARLGKFQNKQIGSGLEGKEGGAGGNTKPEDKENKKPENTQNQNQQNDTPNPDNPGGSGDNPNPIGGGDNPNPNGGSDTPNNQSIRDKDGMVTLANGEKVGGLGIATRNPDGGVTFTSKGADGSKSTDSYDKDGNRTVQTFNGNGEMTSNFKQNKDGSSSGFIKREDGSIDSWNDKPGTYKNVGTIQEKNTPNEGKEK